jgi:hypothetical protein
MWCKEVCSLRLAQRRLLNFNQVAQQGVRGRRLTAPSKGLGKEGDIFGRKPYGSCACPDPMPDP